MYCMPVTLDVSKLSGWLNANATCRARPRHVECDRESWKARGRKGAVWRCTQCARRNRLGTVGTARARGCARKTCASCW
jgi:hypothetical protein